MNTYEDYIEALLNPAVDEESFCAAAKQLFGWPNRWYPDDDHVGPLNAVSSRLTDILDPSTSIGKKLYAIADEETGSRIGAILNMCGELALEDMRQRLANIYADGNLSQPGFLPALAACGGTADVAKVLHSHPDQFERRSAVNAFRQSGQTEEVLSALAHAFLDVDKEVKRLAIFWYFERLPDLLIPEKVHAVEELLRAMSQDEVLLDYAVYDYGRHFGHPTPGHVANFELNYCLGNASAEIRWMAAVLLGETDPRDVDLVRLRSAADDKDKRVRKAVATSLDKLCSTDV